MAARHMLDGVIAQRLRELQKYCPECPINTDQFTNMQTAVAVNLRLRAELSRVITVLKHAEIDFLLIKGFALDVSPLRVMNDIDLLIHDNQLERAFAAMTAAGYRYMGSGVMSEEEIRDPFSTLDWNNQFQFESPAYPVGIEIHTALFEKKPYTP